MRLVVVLLVPLLLVGCSRAGAGEVDMKKTSDRLTDAFEQETGKKLVKAPPVSESTRQMLGLPPINVLGPDGDPELTKTYGDFSIYVTSDPEWRKERLAGRKADAHGNYWFRPSPTINPQGEEAPSAWVAEKPYGKNVLLNWRSQNGRQEISPQWTRLDALMSSTIE